MTKQQEPGELIQDSCQKFKREYQRTKNPTPQLVAEIGSGTDDVGLMPPRYPAEAEGLPDPKTLLKDQVDNDIYSH